MTLADPTDAARLRALVQGMPDLVFEVARDGEIRWLNRVDACATTEGVIGANVLDWLEVPSEREACAALLARVWTTGEPGELRTLGGGEVDGSPPYLTQVWPIVEMDTGAVAGLAVARRELAHSEQQRRRADETAERLDLALGAADLGFWELRFQGETISADARHAATLGYDLDEWDESLAAAQARIHPDDRDDVLRAVKRHLRGEAPVYESQHRERAKDGSWRVVFDRGRLLPCGRGETPRLVGTRLDVTERVAAQHRERSMASQLERAQRLESIGRLAGGVAHEFNNLLQGILGHLAFAAQELDECHPALEDLGEARAACGRAADLTRQLLAFSRKQHVSMDVVDVHRVVGSAARMIASTLNPDVALAVELDGQVPAVIGDAGKVEQVLVNLCLNARDAVGPAGWVRLEARAAARVEAPGEPISEPTPDGPLGDARHWVRFQVADSGSGMPPEVLARAFEPFFTTKPANVGIGLGLAVVLGIVQQHGGHIHLQSEPGEGTVVTLHLPAFGEAAAVPAEVAAEGRASGQPAPGRGERQEAAPAASASAGADRSLLVAEDDPRVRRMLRRAFEQAGFQVVEATDGQDAVERFEATLIGHGDASPPIVAAVLDVAMPRLDGVAALARIHALSPALPALFLTGQPTDQAGAGGTALGAPALSKPVEPAEVVARLSELLPARAGDADAGGA